MLKKFQRAQRNFRNRILQEFEEEMLKIMRRKILQSNFAEKYFNFFTPSAMWFAYPLIFISESLLVNCGVFDVLARQLF